MNKAHIQSALAALSTTDFRETSKNLLATLGYRSERTLELSGTVGEFIEEFPAPNPNTKTEQAFRNSTESIQLLFQFTSDEVPGHTQQRLDLREIFLKDGWTDSFLFFAVTLKAESYSRSRYAEFTREINKRLLVPTVVLFYVGERLTIAFAGRRQHKYDESRDVLEQVTLIKDIRLDKPHRAHLDILSELSLEECVKWMDANDKPKNFDGLLAAWLAKLDTEELNKQFYKQLFDWFEWALQEAKFPTNETKTLSPQEHVIRLITRQLFIWFLKEKGLVAEELFSKAHIQSLLKVDDVDTGDSYYRAVLQNLFFATLNTEIDKRGFSKRTQSGHRNFSRYRYKAEIRDTDKLLSLFAKTPFINGGLFDCLDSEEATADGGYRIDCFSDVHYDKLCIPNRLFFHETRGLFPLLHHYKFTVEENTPIEQEIALDPELLGKVFENLLAAYNPETGATARKQTGSYYTPRAIVDYMVEETIIAALTQKCEPTDGNAKLWDERLRYLLDYAQMFEDANEFFDDTETESIVRAISDLKILDPAVGSGAFPMGTLHKLTLALRRLDPDNTRWERLQKERALQRAEIAFDTQDDETRREELIDIDETFKRYRDSDFGRKLYLIQNSIFGVDIQSIACQIAKLRFFISLAIEQEPDKDAENYGVKPLPNLETRFIAANTLIGLQAQRTLTSNEAQRLERELLDNREQHFHATTRQRKRACKRKDTALRAKLAAELKRFGMPSDDADRIAQWDPYDQNTAAHWFAPEWMFGITEGFDVVIGNPPYVRQEKIKHLKPMFKKRYTCYTGTADLYVYFYERGLQLLNTSGVHTFICSNSWLDVNYGTPLQKYLLDNTASAVICHSEAEREFESADINTIVSILQNGTPDADSCIRFLTFKTFIGDPDVQNRCERTRTYTELKSEGTRENRYTGDKWGGKYLRAPDIYWTILEKGKDKLVRLGDIAEVRFGIKTGANEFFFVNEDDLLEWNIEDEFLVPAIKNVREVKEIVVDPLSFPLKLFFCSRSRKDLEGTNALEYIKWGESQEFHLRPSCRGRPNWWSLGDPQPAPINCNYQIGSTQYFFICPQPFFVSNNFQCIQYAKKPFSLSAALNSSWTQLWVSVMGRTNFGGGLLKIETYETANIIVPNPILIDEQDSQQVLNAAGMLELDSKERKQLDDIIFDALNLTQGEREAVYEGVVRLVEARLRKARSLKEKG